MGRMEGGKMGRREAVLYFSILSFLWIKLWKTSEFSIVFIR